MLRILGIIFMIAHGFGHVQGLIAAVGIKTVEGHHARSWLITPLLGDSLSRVILFIMYAACVCFWVAAGMSLWGVMIPQQMWRTLTITAAIVSTIGVIVFWNALVMPFNRIAALIVNLGAIVLLLLIHWPTDADLGIN